MIFITITIKEGQKFTFGNIELTGQLLGRDDELKSLLKMKKGETFNGELLTDSSKAIQDRLGNYGYALANANVIPEIDRENRIVNINMAVDSGKRVYVRRMNVGGNTRTKDEVIRREFNLANRVFFVPSTNVAAELGWELINTEFSSGSAIVGFSNPSVRIAPEACSSKKC